MTGQEAFAGVLQAASDHIQAVRRETGVAVEIRLTIVGLTVMAGNDVWGHTATVGWQELAYADDLRSLLLAKITEVAERMMLKGASAN
jgi:hypothetical protein